MENQRKEARAAALAQEKKNNTSMVVGAAAIGVPTVDPNMLLLLWLEWKKVGS